MTKLLLSFSALLLCTTVSFGQLKIYHVDVDQADCTLFITPNGSTLLVDAGKNGHGARVKKILQAEGKTRIDYFVNTHNHEDHYGGIDDIENDPQLSVVHAYDRGDKNHLPADKLDEPTYVDYHNAVGNRAVTLETGMQIPVDPAMIVTCMSRGGKVLGESGTATGDEENDMSLSLFIKYGDFWYFVGGDIEEPTEAKIAARDLVMNIDVLQANHHGSHSSSSLSFMQDLLPSVVIISNGSTEKYYHPRKVTLTTYASLNPAPTVFQTNKYTGHKAGGNVPDEQIADLDVDGDDGTILIEVNSPAYTVNYRGKTKSFQIKNRGTVSLQPGSVVIENLLPDPAGSDATEEYVTIKNNSSASVSLAGWTLRDASSRTWQLDGAGQLNAGQSKKIKRNGMAMTLNNDGDLITLLNSTNGEVDHYQYVGSVEGQKLVTGH